MMQIRWQIIQGLVELQDAQQLECAGIGISMGKTFLFCCIFQIRYIYKHNYHAFNYLYAGNALNAYLIIGFTRSTVVPQ